MTSPMATEYSTSGRSDTILTSTTTAEYTTALNSSIETTSENSLSTATDGTHTSTFVSNTAPLFLHQSTSSSILSIFITGIPTKMTTVGSYSQEESTTMTMNHSGNTPIL